jgi:hypothetical protein
MRVTNGNTERSGVMSLFKRLFKRKPDENSVAFRREMAEKVANKHIKYVSERQEGIDVILGKDGSCPSVKDV